MSKYKRIVRMALFIITILLIATTSIFADSVDTASGSYKNSSGKVVVVRIPDINLQKVIRKEAGKTSGILLRSDVEKIKVLHAENMEISNLDGIQYLTNLNELYIKNNKIEDITIIGELINLQVLNISQNNIESIVGVENLTNLNHLIADNNKIKDLSPVSKLPYLATISFYNNNVDNIDALSDITSLYEINANSNKISDISSISKLKGIIWLLLRDNSIRDIEPLKNLVNLKELYISENQIFDITPLKDLTKLSTLDLYGNPILDISPLKSMRYLKEVYFNSHSTSEKLNTSLYKQNDELVTKANEIINSLIKPDMNEYNRLLAIHDYLMTHVTYDWDNYVDETIPIISHSAYGAIVNGVAVCDGYAKAMAILLDLANVESYVIYGDAFGYKGFGGHAWNIVKIDDKYYNLDVTYDDSDPGISYIYFNISDDQLAMDHVWDREKYPNCETRNPYFDNFIQNSTKKQMAGNLSFIVNSNGLYKVDTKEETAELLVNEPVYEIRVEGEWVIYTASEDGGIYKVKFDGTSKIKLEERDSWDIMTLDGWIYYISNFKIYKMNMDGNQKSQISFEYAIFDYDISENEIIYSAYNQGVIALYKMKLDSNNRTQLSTGQVASMYIDGHYVKSDYKREEYISNGLVFYINSQDSNHIYIVKLDGSDRTKINTDDSSEIIVFSDWIYYKNNGDKKYYKIKIDGTERTALE